MSISEDDFLSSIVCHIGPWRAGLHPSWLVWFGPFCAKYYPHDASDVWTFVRLFILHTARGTLDGNAELQYFADAMVEASFSDSAIRTEYLRHLRTLEKYLATNVLGPLESDARRKLHMLCGAVRDHILDRKAMFRMNTQEGEPQVALIYTDIAAEWSQRAIEQYDIRKMIANEANIAKHKRPRPPLVRLDGMWCRACGVVGHSSRSCEKTRQAEWVSGILSDQICDFDVANV